MPIAYLQFSPREAYKLTQEEWERFGDGINSETVEPHISGYLEKYWQEDYGVPAGWTVRYWTTNDYVETLELRMDGSTGEVLSRVVDE